jgi:hypothetical protein
LITARRRWYSRSILKRTRLLLLIFLFPLLASAQVPTLVQHVTCPNSRNTGSQQSNTPDYKCPLPEPSQAGNAIIVGVVSANTGTFTLSDDKSNSYGSPVVSVIDNNGAYVAIYVATNVASGTRFINLHRTTPDADFVEMAASEYYNVASTSAVDSSHCNGNTGSSSTSVTAGSITPSVSGDLLWQWAVNTGGGGGSPNSVTSFTVGSAISWQFLGTSLHDGDAAQAGVYNSTAAIDPTFSSGSSEQWSSCVVALKAASAGHATTNAFRVIHMLHEQAPVGSPSTYPIQFPSSGNLVVVSDISGATPISGISSTPSNTWSSTGTMAGSSGNTAGSQIYYAPNATTSNSLTLSVSLSGAVTDSTFMMYDITGAAVSPFDGDSCPSGGYTNASCGTNQNSNVSSFTTCSSCLTPSGVTGGGQEIIIGNMGINWDTATAVTNPSGALFDAATDTGNNVNGPQYADQNNGWFHYYTSATSALSVTWTMSLGSNAEGWWAGRLAAFKSADSVTQQPAPPSQLKAVVN